MSSFRREERILLDNNWPFYLTKTGKREFRDSTRTKITCVEELTISKIKHPDYENILMQPADAGVIAFQSQSFEDGLQGLVNLCNVTGIGKEITRTTRIEGAEGECVWIYSLPSEAMRNKGILPTKKWRDYTDNLSVRYDHQDHGYILLPPSVRKRKVFQWGAGIKRIKQLPLEMLYLTGLFVKPERKDEISVKARKLSTKSLSSPEAILRVRKAYEIIEDEKRKNSRGGFLDYLQLAFERIEELTPKEGYLVAASAACLFDRLPVGIETLIKFCERWKSRETTGKHLSLIHI